MRSLTWVTVLGLLNANSLVKRRIGSTYFQEASAAGIYKNLPPFAEALALSGSTIILAETERPKEYMP